MAEYEIVSKGLSNYAGEAWLILVDGEHYSVSQLPEPETEIAIFKTNNSGVIDIDWLLNVAEVPTYFNSNHESVIQQWLSEC